MEGRERSEVQSGGHARIDGIAFSHLAATLAGLHFTFQAQATEQEPVQVCLPAHLESCIAGFARPCLLTAAHGCTSAVSLPLDGAPYRPFVDALHETSQIV